MTNDDSEPLGAVVQAAQVTETPSQVYRENADANQPQSSNPPDTPTPPHGATSTTSNGTRAPEPVSLPERHQNALRHIHTLETHNAKLYEDNCRLVNAVNMLNDRLAFLGAPQNAQVFRIADMQERLRVSEANWASANRKYQELLQSISAGSAQHHIGVELQGTQDAYTLLEREYRLLRDKYLRLKAVTDPGRVAQQQSGTARAPASVARPEFTNATQFRLHGHDPSRKSTVSPASVIPPGPFQPFLDQRGYHRRRSSENLMAQPPLRTGPAPIATTWTTPLPTPPPSAPLPGGQVSPTGFPVHTPVPAGSLPLPHHAQVIHDPHNLSGFSPVTRPRHPMEQGTSERIRVADHLSQHSGETADTTKNGSVPCDNPAPTSSDMGPRPGKRPSSELQTSTSPGGEHKKPRIEGETIRPTTANADTYAADGTLSSIASTDNNQKLSVSDPDVRSYQDCVSLIFEKDADIENGVFCGLCLDRYEAKMIQEPPDVLVKPDFDFLVKHCMTMHPTVWDDLRRKT